jgi:hypothetical protein
MLQRPLIDLIAALRRHVELLRIYAHHAFQERNELFLGEVAGKLRMLVAEHGRSQRSLLLDLMDELGANVRLKLKAIPAEPLLALSGHPSAGRQCPLLGE